jgi:5-methylcytosine-specific restriction endonuclease McrA
VAVDPKKQQENKRQWRARNIEKVRASARACYQRNRQANPEKFRERNNKRSAKEREYRRLKGRERYAVKREQLQHQSLDNYYANRESILERMRLRRLADPEKAREREQKYRKNAKINGRLRQYRTSKADAPINDLTHAQWLEIQAAQQHRCYYCQKRRKGNLTQDHIVPLSKQGSHTLHNVIGACQSCNSRKGVRPAPIPVQPFLLTMAPAKRQKTS